MVSLHARKFFIHQSVGLKWKKKKNWLTNADSRRTFALVELELIDPAFIKFDISNDFEAQPSFPNIIENFKKDSNFEIVSMVYFEFSIDIWFR